MHDHDISAWTHHHVFDEGNRAGERGTKLVMAITAAMMVVEIVAGWWYNSMALLADGWHMSSHAVAIGLSALAYVAARRYAHDPRFAFGTWKIEVLAGFSSALFLIGVAVLMVVGSLERLAAPQPIQFDQAILVAAVGLVVNIVSAWILGGAHDHDHHHEHDDADGDHGHHHHHDLNLKSAYLHVLADAATSVLAVAALAGGKFYGWNWLDPVMGLVGAALVAVWAWGLLRETGRVLLDCEMDRPIAANLVRHIEQHPAWPGTSVADLHLWRVGRAKYACIVSLVTDRRGLEPGEVRAALMEFVELAHVTVEVNACPHSDRPGGGERP